MTGDKKDNPETIMDGTLLDGTVVEKVYDGTTNYIGDKASQAKDAVVDAAAEKGEKALKSTWDSFTGMFTDAFQGKNIWALLGGIVSFFLGKGAAGMFGGNWFTKMAAGIASFAGVYNLLKDKPKADFNDAANPDGKNLHPDLSKVSTDPDVVKNEEPAPTTAQKLTQELNIKMDLN